MGLNTAAAREAGNMIDLDSDPLKLMELVRIGAMGENPAADTRDTRRSAGEIRELRRRGPDPARRGGVSGTCAESRSSRLPLRAAASSQRSFSMRWPSCVAPARLA